MTDEERLKSMTAWDKTPVLSQEEITDLLERHLTEDADGVLPSEDGYVTTHNLRAAAREGWMLKLGKAAELISSDLDGNRMSADRIFEHCERMVRKYSGTASPVTARPTVSEFCGFYENS